MAWKKKSDNGGFDDSQNTSAEGSHAYEDNNRNSAVSDDSGYKSSTNVPFSGYGSKKTGSKPYKPQYANDQPNPSMLHPRMRMRAGRYGQGGFARVFQQKAGKPALGASGMSVPSPSQGGSLNGVFGY